MGLRVPAAIGHLAAGVDERKNRRKDAYDNLVRAAVIQTIGFYTGDGQEVLQRIAKDHGGTFRFVPPAPGAKPRNRRTKNR